MIRQLLNFGIVVFFLTACNSSDVEFTNTLNDATKIITTDGNDSLNSAIHVLLGETKSVTLNPAGDQDFYKIILTNPTRLVVEAKKVAAGNVLLSLFDSNGVAVGIGIPEAEGVLKGNLIAAPYYVKVRFSSPEVFSSSPFSLSFYADTTDTTEPNGSFETAFPIQTNATYFTKWSGTGDLDYYRLTIAEAGLHHISTSGVPSANKPRLSLYDFNGVLMRYVDAVSWSNNGNVNISIVAALGERYYVKFENLYTTGSDTPFSLSIRKDLIDTTEYNNTKETAYPVKLEKTYTTKTFPSGDIDFFKLKLAQGTMLQVRVNQVGYQIMPTVSIYDTADALITYGTGYEDTLYAVLGAGTYYIKIDDQNGKSADIPYLLTFASDPIDTMEYNNTMATASPVEIGKSYSTKLYPIGDIDFFKITSVDSTTFTIFLKDPNYPTSTKLSVYDSTGKLILNGKQSGWIDSSLPVTIPAGVFYVKLENPTSSTSEKPFVISFTK